MSANIIVKDCGYALVWVGFAEHDADKTVRSVAFAGFDKSYIDALKITWDENSERSRGPTGTVNSNRTDPTFARTCKATQTLNLGAKKLKKEATPRHLFFP